MRNETRLEFYFTCREIARRSEMYTKNLIDSNVDKVRAVS